METGGRLDLAPTSPVCLSWVCMLANGSSPTRTLTTEVSSLMQNLLTVKLSQGYLRHK